MKTNDIPSSAATGNLLFGLISLAIGVMLICLCPINLVKSLGFALCSYAIYRLVSVAMCVFDIQEKNIQLQSQQTVCLESIAKNINSISKKVDSIEKMINEKECQ